VLDAGGLSSSQSRGRAIDGQDGNSLRGRWMRMPWVLKNCAIRIYWLSRQKVWGEGEAGLKATRSDPGNSTEIDGRNLDPRWPNLVDQGFTFARPNAKTRPRSLHSACSKVLAETGTTVYALLVLSASLVLQSLGTALRVRTKVDSTMKAE
jgi:hypothetical protein